MQRQLWLNETAALLEGAKGDDFSQMDVSANPYRGRVYAIDCLRSEDDIRSSRMIDFGAFQKVKATSHHFRPKAWGEASFYENLLYRWIHVKTEVRAD
jgi:hypothetical protein